MAFLATAVQDGYGVYSRPSSRAPMPYGPPILWPETVAAASPEAAKSTGT